MGFARFWEKAARRALPVSMMTSGFVFAVAAAAQAAPHITGYTPAHGPTTGGATLTINGTNFSADGNTVTIGTIPCPPSAEGTSSIECPIPEGTGTNLEISVIDAFGTPSDNTTTFSYDPPLLSGISPVMASTAGGSRLTLFGTNFGPAAADDKRSVSFGTAGTCVIVPGAGGHGSVECTLPEGQGGPHDVAITVDGQTSGARSFSYAAPSITSISPSSAREAGGVRLTISGASFGTTAAATVGGHPCPVQTQTHTSIECTVPQGTGTGVNVAVVVAGQLSNTKPFDYLPAPSIFSIFPTNGSTAGNIPLTVNGSSFSATGNTVTVGSRQCVPDTQLQTRIVCTLPEGSGADQPVEVVSDGERSNTALFDYDAPTIDSLTPASAATSGGIRLTVRGASFGSAAADGLRSVVIGTSNCPLVPGAGGHTELQCTLPAGQGLGLTAVVTVDGQDSASSTFNYDAPTIDSITPAHLATTGGFPITISGANFGFAATATVGGANCPVTGQTHTSLVCTLPPGSAGAAPVQVVVSGQGTGSSLTYSAIACGDGFVDDGEPCDDANLVENDGCSSGCEAEHVQDKDQQACIVALNKAGAGVAKAQGAAVADCARSASAGTACVDVSVPSSLTKAMGKTSASFDKKCSSLPDFGPTEVAATNDAAVDGMLALAHDYFGADADAALLPDAMDPGRAACQQGLIDSSNKVVTAVLKAFGKCKKTFLKDGTIRSASNLKKLCLGYIDEDVKAAKAGDSLAGVFIGACADVSLGSALPGSCTAAPDVLACIGSRLRCRTCLMLAATDGLNSDCDLFDDAAVNSSCP